MVNKCRRRNSNNPLGFAANRVQNGKHDFLAANKKAPASAPGPLFAFACTCSAEISTSI
jgi:hypothetical protein